MTKGHNKGTNNDPNPEEKVQGQDRHLTNKDRQKSPAHGRNPDPDPSAERSSGSKGKNNVK